jgi:HlyD family secretion protein
MSRTQAAVTPNASAPATTATVTPLRAPGRWHDPLGLICAEAPDQSSRIVLRALVVLMAILLLWAAFGQVDIIVSAEGKLAPQTLIKIVQPAEGGVVRKLLVTEGDVVKAGQMLVQLDTTLARADYQAVASDLAMQRLQERRLEAALHNQPMRAQGGDDPQSYAQVERQDSAHRAAYRDNLEQEKSLLQKAEYDLRSAREVQVKLEQSLPVYREVAASLGNLAKDGYVTAHAAADKNREMGDKEKDLSAQQAAVAAAQASVAAQARKVIQIQSSYQSALQTELAEVRAKISQLQPTLDKSHYKENVMTLFAPQDGVVKALSTTTVGSVVQPGAVLITLVPVAEPLFADVLIKNEDIAFVQAGQKVRLKLAAYPFQRYGMLDGTVLQVGADATEAGRNGAGINDTQAAEPGSAALPSTYRARVQLNSQSLLSPQGRHLALNPGMQLVAEFNQGQRSVLEYLLSPIQKTIQEAGRER